MNYEEAINFLYGLERFGEKGSRLIRMNDFLDRLGNPHEEMEAVHVTGTSGKGSTVAMITSMIKAAGYRVGMYISPHLSDFTERMSVNKEKIPKKEVVRQVEEIKPIIERMGRETGVHSPSFFEAITALMFKYFKEQDVEVAVLEVGLGGRLDATNVITPIVSVITNIHLEHTDILGESIQEIAREKGAIIKEGRVALTAEDKRDALTVLRRICTSRNATLYRVGQDVKIERESESFEGQLVTLQCFEKKFEGVQLPLLGTHQLRNAGLAVGAVGVMDRHGFSFTENAIRKGLKCTKWLGRLEIMQRNPLIVLDCAKDPAAAKNLKENVERIFDPPRLILVTSISADKDIRSMLASFSTLADEIIITKHNVMNRATPPEEMAKEIEKRGNSYEIIRDVKKAVRKAESVAGRDDMVLITGSVFTVGKARELWFDEVEY